MKKLLIALFAVVLSACGGGGSDSGSMVEPTIAGTNIPAIFVGTYRGTANITVEASILNESDTVEITIIVTDDGMVVLQDDDQDELFRVGLEDSGAFRGNYSVSEIVEECTGNIAVVGTVDGTTASGTLSGEGECEDGILSVSATLTGDFTATKQ